MQLPETIATINYYLYFIFDPETFKLSLVLKRLILRGLQRCMVKVTNDNSAYEIDEVLEKFILCEASMI